MRTQALSFGVRMKRLFDAIRLRWMVRRGDALIDAQAFWDGVIYLVQELMPEPEWEMPRDLFCLLAYAWAVRAGEHGQHDPFAILRQIRNGAWLGYVKTPALVAEIRATLPRADAGRRMALYFEELAAKHGTYLFLPCVSRVDQHQAGRLTGPLALDTFENDFACSSPAIGRMCELFRLPPEAMRQRNAILVALLIGGWGKGPQAMLSTSEDFYAGAALQLRLLYDQPERAVRAVRADAGSYPMAAQLIRIVEELNTEVGRPLWLEALFLVENALRGPQHFQHAFEIKAGPIRDVLD
jgi:hypothetical protein